MVGNIVPIRSSIKQQMDNEVSRALRPYLKKLEKETDNIKKTKLIHKAFLLELKIFLKYLTTVKQKDFELLLNDMLNPLETEYAKFNEKVDLLAYDHAKSPREFEDYKIRKNLQSDYLKGFSNIIDKMNLNKTGFERFSLFLLIALSDATINAQKEAIENLEWFLATNVVQTRLGFDQNWLMGMALIQLHENLIKKKLSDVGYKITRDDKMPYLISKLGFLIEQKEKRDVKLELEMSQGLKRIRDLMTHQGYKYKISKSNLTKIMKEIQNLEQILYPNTKV